jgi:hypothetical protein
LARSRPREKVGLRKEVTARVYPQEPNGSTIGHASISIILDRYWHLMPGAHGEAASLLDTYLGAS